jgi:hypothetical protein
MFAGGELSELEKATMIGRASQRRATIPAASRYCKVYARDGACTLRSATNATMALSILRLMLVADPSNTAHRSILSSLSRRGLQLVSFRCDRRIRFVLTEIAYAYLPRNLRRRSRRLSLASIFNQAKAQTQ